MLLCSYGRPYIIHRRRQTTCAVYTSRAASTNVAAVAHAVDASRVDIRNGYRGLGGLHSALGGIVQLLRTESVIVLVVSLNTTTLDGASSRVSTIGGASFREARLTGGLGGAELWSEGRADELGIIVRWVSGWRRAGAGAEV